MKKEKFQRAASESVVARMVARVFGVAGSDYWHEVAQRASESEAAQYVPWSLTEIRRYPWVVGVPGTVYKCSKKEQLIIDLIADLGTVFLVKDEGISGADGLWLVTAEDSGNGDNNAGYAVSSAPVSMLVNHAFTEENIYTITAIQLTSCLRSQ